MNSSDIELLRRYVFERSEAAFADLVRQHIALVYSAALRQTSGNAPLAEDVTQEVFTSLALKATRLTRHTSIAGWLYTSTRYAATTLRRAEHRRCAREQEAHAMNQLLQSAGTDPAWEQLRPVLDEATHDLKADDREAVLLRYFEHLPLAAVGARLGLTENTARMRVDRALDKLRGALVKRGVTSTAGALAVILTGQAAGAVPAGLAAAVSGKAVTTAGAASALSVLLASFLMSTKLKLLAGTAALIVLVASLVGHWEGSNQRAAIIPQSVEPASAVSGAQADVVSASDNPATQTASPTMTNASALRLTILAADANKPVAAVEMECTANKDKQQTRGKFVSRRDGICDVYYPKDTDALVLVSRTDGFADTILHWEPAKGDTIPANYVLRLIRAVHIGGYVREEDGSPVPGAKLEFRREGTRADPALAFAPENHEFNLIEAVADSEGRWSLDRIAPDMLGRTAGNVNHPNYFLKFEFFGSSEAQTLLREAAFVFKLSRAAMIRGTVVDTQGNPISGAKVVVAQVGPLESAITLADGSFEAKRGQPEPPRISITAKGFVPRVMELKPGDDSVHVILEPGRALQLKVVDQAGQPVSGAKIAADLPGTIPAPLSNTDAEGRATISEAPAGSMALTINAADCQSTNVTLSVEGQEYVIVLARDARLAVSGTVTDAASGQPIPAFRVICGTALATDSPSTNLAFVPSPKSVDWLKFGGGKFRMDMGRSTRSYFMVEEAGRRQGFMLKFEADGYAPSISRVIGTNESEVQLDLALVPAQTINVTVLNPNGRPAADADVGLLRPGVTMSVMVVGRLNLPQFRTGLLRADSKGGFPLPPDDSIKRVIAINAQGFAEASPSALSRAPTLQLQPFGRLEGQWLPRNQPVPGRKLVLGVASIESPGYAVDCSATTDGEGRFTFARVPAGKYELTSNTTDESGDITSKGLTAVEVRPGETSTITVGAGYVVSLRLRWPADLAPEKILAIHQLPTLSDDEISDLTARLWGRNGRKPSPAVIEAAATCLRQKKASARSPRIRVTMHTPSPEVPASIVQDPQALAHGAQSPETQVQLRDVRNYEFVEGADDSWTTDAVQAGATYLLEARAAEETATNSPLVLIAYGQMSVTIPAEPPTGTFDAGEMVLQSIQSSSSQVPTEVAPLVPDCRN